MEGGREGGDGGKTHPKCHCMSNSKLGNVPGPQRLEVFRQANLATAAGQGSIQVGVVRKTWTYRYIFAVLPSSSGMAISGAVAGYVMGIWDE